MHIPQFLQKQHSHQMKTADHRHTDLSLVRTRGLMIEIPEISLLPQFSRSVLSNSLQPRGLQYARLPHPSPTPGVYSNSCPSSLWCEPTISSHVAPFFSCLQSFPLLPHHQPIWKLSTSWSNTLMPLPHTIFKNLFLSAIGELRTLEHEMTVLLAWYLAINTVFSYVETLSQ